MPAPSGTAKYTRQRIVMLDEETDARIMADKLSMNLSISEVLRTYVEAGIRYADDLIEETDT